MAGRGARTIAPLNTPARAQRRRVKRDERGVADGMCTDCGRTIAAWSRQRKPRASVIVRTPPRGALFPPQRPSCDRTAVGRIAPPRPVFAEHPPSATGLAANPFRPAGPRVRVPRPHENPARGLPCSAEQCRYAAPGGSGLAAVFGRSTPRIASTASIAAVASDATTSPASMNGFCRLAHASMIASAASTIAAA